MNARPGSVLAVATLDTKGEEIQWVADCLKAAGVAVRIVDVSSQGHQPSRLRSVAAKF